MTENPYACSDGRIIGRRGEAWNEGYDQALRDVVAQLHLNYMDISDIEALRKKVID